jgi:hypothetical protein
MTVFQASTFTEPPQQVNAAVRRRERRCPMVRLCIFAVVVVGLSSGQARPDEKEDPLNKDLSSLKGMWLLAKEKDKENARTLLLGKDEPFFVLGPGGKFGEAEKGRLSVLTSAVEKDKKRYLKFIGVFEKGESLLEYELSGDKLKLKGEVGDIDVSGD